MTFQETNYYSFFFSFSLFPVSRKKKNGTVKNARIKINLIEKIKNK